MKYTQISDMRIAGHNVKMSKYVYYKYNDIQTLSNLPVGGFTKSSNYIYVNDSTPSGSFQYELADESKTTEQGTPFTENMDINDMGNMAWYSAYTDENTNTPVAVPQGCKIFYPAWYAGFIDTLGQREDIDWVPDEIVSQEQISDSALSDRGYIKLTSITGYDATKTQVLKNVEGTLTWVDEE